jgi:hypothetical protein
MARLAPMPPLMISQSDLILFVSTWKNLNGRLSRTPPQSSGEPGRLFDVAVGTSLARMLGDIPVVTPTSTALLPSHSDCVEVGHVRIIGGVRPQNFDVGYRPDGVRFAFDSKTLNDRDSVGKNWQNMVNDLATEATTVHSRFSHAIVAFLIAIPTPCTGDHQRAIIETLERLARRANVDDQAYMAESISLVLWNPDDGTIDHESPSPLSPLRVEKFSEQVEAAYVNRYKGLPPHAE